MEDKKKISPFEFAIMEIADPKEAEKYKPFTEKEVFEQRKENIEKQFSQLKVKQIN